MAETGTTAEGAVALLLDYENAQDADIRKVLAEASAFGRVIVRRAYADWNKYASAQGKLREAGFEAVHQFTSGGAGKNASDIHVAVDAMDILYTRPVDTFVIVSADSDFATLVRRLREGGKRVIGMGNRLRVGRSLVQSCDQYIYYDQDKEPKRKRRKPAETKSPEKPAAKPVVLTDLHRIVLEALESGADDQGQMAGGPLHERIRRIRPDFNYRDYGFSSFLKFLESLEPVLNITREGDVSDVLVEVASEYEDAVEEAIDETGTTLSKDVQETIHTEWRERARKGRLSGRAAAGVVSDLYGVSRLSDTPLETLAGVLDAAPLLAERWSKEGGGLVLNDKKK